MAIPGRTFLTTLVTLTVYFINVAFLSLYHNGDLYYYRSFYEAIKGISVNEILDYQLKGISSGEPVYGGLMWIFSNAGVPHDLLIAAINTALLSAIFRFLKKYKASVFFIFLTFSNYYLLVLLTGAERLKIAFVLILLATLSSNRLQKILLLAVTPFAHVQMSVHVVAVLAGQTPRIGFRGDPGGWAIKKKYAASILLFIPFVAILLLLSHGYFNTIIAKIYYYSSGGAGLTNSSKILALLIAGLVVLRERSSFALSMIVLVGATLVIGSDRFQIGALALLAYYTVVQSKTRHPLILAILAYFSLKSMQFVASVIEHGHGFGHVVENVLQR